MSTDDEQDECRCGQIHEPMYKRLLDWFDAVIEDKGYRHHDWLIGKVDAMFGDTAAKLDKLQQEHAQRDELPAARAFHDAAQVVRDHVGIV